MVMITFLSKGQFQYYFLFVSIFLFILNTIFSKGIKTNDYRQKNFFSSNTEINKEIKILVREEALMKPIQFCGLFNHNLIRAARFGGVFCCAIFSFIYHSLDLVSTTGVCVEMTYNFLRWSYGRSRLEILT